MTQRRAAARSPAESPVIESGASDAMERVPFRPEAITPHSAADQIAAQLRTALVDGILRPGDRLSSEPELAEEFHVSRATVREAIKILRAQGVLRTTRGARGGHFVISPRTDTLAESVGQTFGLWFDAGDISVAEVDEARVVVERACVRLAAVRREDADLDEMDRLLTESATPGLTLNEFLSFDLRFHRAIAMAARNRLLELPMMAIHMVRPRTNQLLRRHDPEVVVRQHRGILAGIAAGDADQAESAFIHHATYLERERQAAVLARKRSANEIALHDIGPPEQDLGDPKVISTRS